MNSKDRGSGVPKNVAQKLRAIRRRTAAITFLRGFLLSSTVLIGAALLAMMLDWLIGWFDVRARYAITGLAAAAAAVALLWWCIRPLMRRHSIVSTAREVDAILPQLEERWSTVTELSQTHDAPEKRGSEAMINRVAAEADSASANILPESVVSARPALAAARCLAVVTAVLVLFFAFNFSSAGLLLRRFVMPGQDISLTRVNASPGNVWVAKGEPLTLNATVNGRVRKAAPKLYQRTGSRTKEVPMVPKTSEAGAFLHSLEDVSESFEYRVRAGDGQTPWLRITAVERPVISEVRLKVSPPAYSKLPAEEKSALPNAVRVLHGSEVEVSFRCDQPLEHLSLDFGNRNSTRLTSQGDNWYHFRTVATNSFTLSAAAINQFKLESKMKPSCRVSVYEDLPPTVKILEPSDDIAVLPDEKVTVVFEATDDLGLAKAEVIVSTTKADGATNTVRLPVEVAASGANKQLKKSVQLDPKSLGLNHGDQLSYTVQVTDTRQTPGAAEAKSPVAGQQVAGAKADSAEQKDAPPAEGSQAAAKASQRHPEQKQNTGSQRPPDTMERRMLDAGQSAACQPRNILVDEWAGSHAGQKRKKLEIAIEPILKQLDLLLASALQQTEALKQAVTPGPLTAAKRDITESRTLIEDLKSRTSGTPYAFIGLQLHNISEAHILPAGLSFDQVIIPGETNLVHLDKAAFHLTRARAMLADLTRTYETVKRDQQVADTMQKLNKMYQVFLEDTQALLGSSKGPINSYDRKMAEVDEAYVEKLREMLEQKKQIMAEMARLLADDPRMLRRYLAMMEQQADSLRDQLTLLAERQKQIQTQVSKWNATPEGERPALIAELKQSYAAGQRDLTAGMTKLRENMETWLPLDIKPEQAQVQAALARAERAVQLTATNGYEALKELRALRETIPQFSELKSTNRARLTSYIANRLPEVERLITAQSGHMALTESLANGEFPRVAEIVQHGLTQDTVTLSSKLIQVEEQVAGMSEEIAAKAEMLNQVVQVDIVERQRKSVDQLAAQQMKPAEGVLTNLPPAFALGEKTFDELMRLIVEKLDQAPAPSEPGEPAGLESLLSMLEEEQKAAEGLGIPCRPLNVSVMRDWMRPGANPGQGQGMAQAQAQAAQAQAQQGRDQTQRLEKQARESAATALAEAQKESDQAAAAQLRSRGEAWNKLASRLKKDLLQGRDNTPPEQYRQAIESYFKVISETTRE